MPELDSFLKWIARAPRGKRRVYHVGSLMYDRERSVNKDFAEVNAIAEAAWDAHKAGHVVLTQRKLSGQHKFEYVATAT